MGKPFAAELAAMPETYAWGRTTAIDRLAAILARLHDSPLIAVGSGGSLSAAHMAAQLHTRSGYLARAVTPLEYMQSCSPARESSVLLLTAGGTNRDVLACFRAAAKAEHRHVAVLCMSNRTPLSGLAREFEFTDLIEYPLPSGKDGFLATNSLLGLFVLLCRGYGAVLGTGASLPQDLPGYALAFDHSLFSRFSWSVLYSGWSQPVAVDIESKFTEAALGHVSPADYRNFAHGRHHWYAKHPDSSGILALVTPEDRRLATRTLRLMPASVPVLEVSTEQTGPAATIELFWRSLEVVRAAGICRNIDPGRPGVPEFGRRIYSLTYTYPATKRRPSIPPMPDAASVAIQRKVSPRPIDSLSGAELAEWSAALTRYVEHLEEQRVAAVVLDYDGTLCDSRERDQGLGSAVAERLIRLLERGIRIGIVTGRGKSVRHDLIQSVPTALQSRVLMGYYNGAYLHRLDEELDPEAAKAPCEELRQVLTDLQRNPRFSNLATLDERKRQIGITPQSAHRLAEVCAIIEQVAVRHLEAGIRFVRSGHSVDLLAPAVSKLNLVVAIEELVGQGSGDVVLRIGDQGRWPGNDYALLDSRYSLSVHEVSHDPGSCWNLAPAGMRGVQATIWHLDALQDAPLGGRFRFQYPRVRSSQ